MNPSTDFGRSVADNALNQGRNSINSFDPSAKANNFLQGYNAQIGAQQGQSQDYMKQYANQIASNPTATDYYNQGNERYGVQGLWDRANQLNNAVLTTPQQNVDRMKGFNADAGQIQAQTTQDLARLSPLAIAATNNAQTAQGLASGYATAGQAQTALNLRPVESYGQMLNESFARQSTGYTTAMQSELEALSQKMQAGVQLSQSELERANQLAQYQTSYQNTLAQTEAQKSVAQTEAQAKLKAQQLQNQFANLAAGNTLVNTMTGGVYRAR